MQPPQDRSPGSEPVYCSVLEFQTDTTDIIEMTKDNYPEAQRAFDYWDSRDHRRRPQLANPYSQTAKSHRGKSTSHIIGGSALSWPYPMARRLDQSDLAAPGTLSNIPGAVEYNASPFEGYPQEIQNSIQSLSSQYQQYSQQGTSPQGSSANFSTFQGQNGVCVERPAWEQNLLFQPYDQPQSLAPSMPNNTSPSTEDNVLTFNQGDFYSVDFADNVTHGGEPLQYYSDLTPCEYQESFYHGSPAQISPLEINGNILNPTTNNPCPEGWNQLLYQYPPQDSPYRHRK